MIIKHFNDGEMIFKCNQLTVSCFEIFMKYLKRFDAEFFKYQ